MSKEIKFAPNSNIESVVYELLAAKARGEQVYGEFEGHKLYSDTITMELAYKEIHGCTKEEYEKKKKEEQERVEKEKNEQIKLSEDQIKPISTYDGKVLESKYFSLKIDKKLKANFDLSCKCASFLSTMGYADAKRTLYQKALLKEYFLETICACKTDAEIEGISKIMKDLANMGGYAVIFYEEIKSYLSKDGISKAKNDLKSIQEKKQPVSTLTNGMLKSPYLDVKPEFNDARLYNQCEDFVRYLCMVDIKKTNIEEIRLTRIFFRILQNCNKDDDFIKLKNFLEKLSKNGGYALLFYNIIQEYINEQGKKKATNILENNEIKMNKALAQLKIYAKEFQNFKNPEEEYSNDEFLEKFMQLKQQFNYIDENVDYGTEQNIEKMSIMDSIVIQSPNLQKYIIAILNPEVEKKLLEKIERDIKIKKIEEAKKEMIKKTVQNMQRKKIQEEEEKQKKKTNENWNELKETFKRLNRVLEEMQESKSLDEDELYSLYRKYNQTQECLYQLHGKIDRVEFYQYEEKIEEKIKVTKQLIEELEEIKKIMRF